MDAGSILGIVGRSADNGYWVISVPTSIAPSVHGWVDASMAQVSKTETENMIPVISPPQYRGYFGGDYADCLALDPSIAKEGDVNIFVRAVRRRINSVDAMCRF